MIENFTLYERRLNIDDLESKYVNIVGEKVFNKFKAYESYLIWLLKNWSDNNDDYLIDLVKSFIFYKSILKSNNIYDYSHKSLQEELTPYLNEKVYEDINIKIFKPSSEKSCYLYSRNTKWCIGIKNSNWFKEYINDNIDIYIIYLLDINKKNTLANLFTNKWFNYKTDEVIDGKPSVKSLDKIGLTHKDGLNIINSDNYQLLNKYNFQFCKELDILNFTENL